MLPEDTTTLVGAVIIALLALSWHEAAHAWVADRLGDPTARMLGRVTLNPLKHLDPFMSVILPALMYFMAGVLFVGGKPVPINVMNFRHRARDFMLVALAGPFANLLMAAAFGLLFIVSAWTGLFPPMTVANSIGPDNVFAPTFLPWPEWDSPFEGLLKLGVLINLVLALFNLLPVPPLDGSRLVGWLLPRPMQTRWYALDRMGFLVIILLLLVLGGLKYVWIGLIVAFNTAGFLIDEILALKSLV